MIAAICAMPHSTGGEFLRDLGFDLRVLRERINEQLEALKSPKAPDIATLRRSYAQSTLHEDDLDADPLLQLNTWLHQAIDAELLEPYAMNLATVDAAGQPSSRIVLLRGLDDRGLMFYTSYLSRKGVAISTNPRVALVFYWPQLERQVRVEGLAEQLSEQESDAYFASRPRGHQLSAWASEQSEPVESQALLAQRVEDYSARFEGEDVPRPHSWGGYLVRPHRIEFWQGRENRLHDRLEFVKDGTAWRLQRLSP